MKSRELFFNRSDNNEPTNIIELKKEDKFYTIYKKGLLYEIRTVEFQVRKISFKKIFCLKNTINCCESEGYMYLDNPSFEVISPYLYDFYRYKADFNIKYKLK